MEGKCFHDSLSPHHIVKYRATEGCMTLPPLLQIYIQVNLCYNYGRGVS